MGIAIPQNRGTQKTLLQKKKEKIIRQRILANPLTSQKTTFCGETGCCNSERQQVGTAEDLTAAEWMFDMVKTIAPSARKPNFAGWANDIRLMRERDGRNHRDMCVLFRWACQDNFWSGNVLSPAKLRDKWTQLEINRNKQQAGVTACKPKLDLTNTDWIYGVDL